MKTAVVLFNLGGPDKTESVQPFLFNLFNDKKIINLPNPLRYFLAKLISKKRNREAVEIYSQIGGKSPILATTSSQAAALERKLNKENGGENKVFVCMRYWHPMTPEVVRNVKDYNPDKVILLPLYPQYSTATTESSIEQRFKSAKNINLKKQTNYVCCYPKQKTFLKAHVELIKSKTSALKNFRLLFSAHGLPEVTIKKGDPYQWQIEKTVEGVVGLLGDVDYTICYQSRVGPLKWIGPSTPEAIDKAIRDDVEIVVVPIAFVSDHSETLVELDIEYREYAKQKGFNKYNVVQALNLNETFIKALYELVISSINSDKVGNITNKICPLTFKKCKNKNVI